MGDPAKARPPQVSGVGHAGMTYDEKHGQLIVWRSTDARGIRVIRNLSKFVRTVATFKLCLIVATCSAARGQCPQEYEHANYQVQLIENQWPLRSRHDPISVYVHNLTSDIARSYQKGRLNSWSPRVLRDYSPNAYSVGAGYFYVTEGAIRICRNESELAAIVAHEMGHQLAGHFCPEEPRQNRSFFMPSPWFGRSSSRPDRPGIEKGWLTQHFDIERECEADRLAVEILTLTRFDAHAMLDIARRLPNGSVDAAGAIRVEELAKFLKRTPKRSVHDSDAFRKAQQELEDSNQEHQY